MNNKMIVVYYVNTYYLDAAIEILQSIKNEVELHLLIEISPESKKTNIIEVEDVSRYNTIVQAEHILGIKKWNELKVHFEGIKSVQFVVFNHKRTLSISSIIRAFRISKLIRKIRPDVVHFDSISIRTIGIFPWIKKNNVFITVHDPKPHSGEGSWKIKLVEKIYFRIAKGLLFYSEFAKNQFQESYNKLLVPKWVIYFQPFTFLKQFSNNITVAPNSILFFGRILLYKGVDLLLSAIPQIIQKYPQELFIIAGKLDDVILDTRIIDTYKNNIKLIPNHISTVDLTALIESSKFVICPYRDATQSGVLMTANALGKMVVATNVGAFPEYICNEHNGLLTEPDKNSIANSIMSALDKNRYKDMEMNVQSERSIDLLNKNKHTLLNAYTQ